MCLNFVSSLTQTLTLSSIEILTPASISFALMISKVTRNYIFKNNIASCSGCRYHKCTLLPIWSGIIVYVPPCKSFVPLILIVSVPAPLMFAPILLRKIRKINNMRFFCCIFDNGNTVCGCRRKHSVDCRSDGYNVKENISARKIFGRTFDNTF